MNTLEEINQRMSLIMDERITVYSIELTERKNEEKFYDFMLNELFPAIPKKMTRTGQVTRLVLLQSNIFGHSHEYLWLVYGDELIDGGAARNQINRIETFGAKVSPIQDFVECVRWSIEDDLKLEKLL
jgi:hypothetical protein